MVERLEGLSIGLSLDTIQVDAGLKDLRKSMSLLNSELKANLSRFDYSEKSAAKYETRLEGLNKKLELQRKITEKARKTYEKMVAEYGEGSAEAQKAAREYNNQSANLQNLQRSVERTTKEMEAFRKEQARQNSGWTKTGEALEKTGSKFVKVGDGMKGVGKKLSTYVTAPLTGLGVGAFKASVDFESAFAGVRKTVDASEADFLALEEGIRSMAMELPASAAEISAVAESAGQLGIETPNILDFTRTIIDLGEATNLTTEQAATEFARFANIVQMPQENFDRLGSTVVALGNNLATTEAEIVSMGMRLAGTGAQIGLTESEMMALAGAMSSVGIEAEAGGTAMSTVMKKMQNAVSEGGESLERFASASGMSAKEFAAVWKSDPMAAIEAFIGGLSDSSESGENLNGILEELGITGIRETDTLLRLSGASDVLASAVDISSSAWEENTALTEEAEQRYATTESQIEMLKNSIVDISITLGDILVPMVMEVVEKVKEAVNWFRNLDEETQENIVRWGLLALAIGPVIAGFGTLISSIGHIIGPIGTLMKWIGANGGLTGAFTVLGGKVTSVAAFLSGPWGLAIAAVLAGGYLLVDHFSQDAIPAVEGFGDEVSETTAEMVQDFLDMSGGVQTELDLLFANGTVITEEGAAEIVGQFQAMTDTIEAELAADHEKNLSNLSEFFAESSAMNSEHEQKILTNMQNNHAKRNEQLQTYEDRAEEIMATAKEEKRALTQSEHDELSSIREKMNKLAVHYLSDSAIEQIAIQDSLRVQSGAINARQAADTVKKSAEARDGAVKEASARADETIQTAIYLRDVTGDLSAEEADQIIAEAERQREGAIDEANERHERVIDIAKEQAGDHVKEVDWETGEVLSRWDVFTRDLVKGAKEGAQETLDSFKEAWDDIKRTGNELNDWVENLVMHRIPNSVRKGYSAVKGAFAKFINGGIEAVESGVNGIIKGINWVLDKLGSKTRIASWNAGRVNSGSGTSGSTQGRTRRYAKGTDSHPGGPAIVGDGGMRELVLYPNGHMALSPDTDTLLDLPRGTQVLSGPETKQLLDLYDVPAYKSGIGDVLGSIWDWVSGGAKNLMNKALDFLGINPPDIAGALGSIAKAGFNLVKDHAVGYFDRNKDKFMGPPGGINFRGLRRTSGYGPRRSPGGIGSTYHRGVDYAGPVGTVIQSQTPGVVSASSFNPISGNYVMVKQGQWQYRYQHNLRNLVRPGQSVTKGQPLALLGSTGASTGPHLHFEIWKNGRRINPEPFIGGFADGGLVNQEGVYQLAEGGYPEFVIPTDPAKRTDAMKLLAIAAKQLQANKSPQQLPTPSGGGDDTMVQLLQATLEQNQILRALLEKDTDVHISRDRLAAEVNHQNAYNELGGFFNV